MSWHVNHLDPPLPIGPYLLCLADFQPGVSVTDQSQMLRPFGLLQRVISRRYHHPSLQYLFWLDTGGFLIAQ